MLDRPNDLEIIKIDYIISLIILLDCPDDLEIIKIDYGEYKSSFEEIVIRVNLSVFAVLLLKGF